MEIIKYGNHEGSKPVKIFRCPVCGCIFKAYSCEYETEVDGDFVSYHCNCPICSNISSVFEDNENTFAPMKVSVAVPTADGAVALVKVNDIEELNNIKKNGVTKEMIENVEKLKQNEAAESVDSAPQQIKVGRVYRHFKGKLYLVLAVAKHSETGDPFVVYKALYGDCQVYIRPFMMFASEVDREKYPDVEQQFRFELVED